MAITSNSLLFVYLLTSTFASATQIYVGSGSVSTTDVSSQCDHIQEFSCNNDICDPCAGSENQGRCRNGGHSSGTCPPGTLCNKPIAGHCLENTFCTSGQHKTPGNKHFRCIKVQNLNTSQPIIAYQNDDCTGASCFMLSDGSYDTYGGTNKFWNCIDTNPQAQISTVPCRSAGEADKPGAIPPGGGNGGHQLGQPVVVGGQSSSSSTVSSTASSSPSSSMSLSQSSSWSSSQSFSSSTSSQSSVPSSSYQLSSSGSSSYSSSSGSAASSSWSGASASYSSPAGQSTSSPTYLNSTYTSSTATLSTTSDMLSSVPKQTTTDISTATETSCDDSSSTTSSASLGETTTDVSTMTETTCDESSSTPSSTSSEETTTDVSTLTETTCDESSSITSSAPVEETTTDVSTLTETTCDESSLTHESTVIENSPAPSPLTSQSVMSASVSTKQSSPPNQQSSPSVEGSQGGSSPSLPAPSPPFAPAPSVGFQSQPAANPSIPATVAAQSLAGEQVSAMVSTVSPNKMLKLTSTTTIVSSAGSVVTLPIPVQTALSAQQSSLLQASPAAENATPTFASSQVSAKPMSDTAPFATKIQATTVPTSILVAPFGIGSPSNSTGASGTLGVASASATPVVPFRSSSTSNSAIATSAILVSISFFLVIYF